MAYKDILSLLALALGSCLLVWLANRFRRFVSNKITTNHQISERQFWREPITSREQALAIMRRASRDFIGLGILLFFTAGSDDHVIDYGKATVAAILLLLAFLTGKRSKVAAGILAAAYLLLNIAVLIPLLISLSQINIAPAIVTYQTTLPLLPIIAWATAASWMAWRAFQAARVTQA